MDTAFKVLVIIVSSALTLFLLVVIIAVIKIIQIINRLKLIAEKADKIADSAEVVSSYFRKTAGPLAFGRFISNVIETVVNHKKEK